MENKTINNPKNANSIKHNVICRFSDDNMIAFGEFIRDNYYVAGAPRMISYNPTKYPHGTITEIFVYWCCENGI